MADHDERLRGLSKNLRPKVPDDLWSRIEPNLPKHLKKKAQHTVETARAIVKSTLSNGAGHLMDQ